MADPQIFHQIRASLNAADLRLTPPPAPRLPRDLHLSFIDLIWFANLPGIWIDFVDSIRTWPYTWFPSGFPILEVWRALTFPVAASIFWSWVGTGVDYFLSFRNHAKIRIRWFAFAGSVIAFLFAAIIALGGTQNDDPGLHPPAFNHAMIGIGVIWMILSAICCAAWVHQFIQKRKKRALMPIRENT